MALPAHQYDPVREWNRPPPSASKPAVTKTDEKREDVSIKIGKMIFYITIALGPPIAPSLSGMEDGNSEEAAN